MPSSMIFCPNELRVFSRLASPSSSHPLRDSLVSLAAVSVRGYNPQPVIFLGCSFPCCVAKSRPINRKTYVVFQDAKQCQDCQRNNSGRSCEGSCLCNLTQNPYCALRDALLISYTACFQRMLMLLIHVLNFLCTAIINLIYANHTQNCIFGDAIFVYMCFCPFVGSYSQL